MGGRFCVLRIDGSDGEGGGQLLRTALGLAVATRTPFTFVNLRPRAKPAGLTAPLAACVQAAATLAAAEVTGGKVGATELTFRPTALRAGEHRLSAGNGGSALLLLQTLLPALLTADAPVQLTIQGNTLAPGAPPVDFAQQALVPLLAQMGAAIELQVVHPGLAPAGGGSLLVRSTPPPHLQRLEVLQAGAPRPLRARALLSKLPDDIGRRQLVALAQRLGIGRLHPEHARLERLAANAAGNVLLLELPRDSHTEVLCAFGERGAPAMQVADLLATEALALLARDVPVGPHLADQLLVPMALAGGGAFVTVEPTLHCTSNAALIERFLPVRFAMREAAAGAGRWRIDCTAV